MTLTDFAEKIAEMNISNFTRLLYDPDPNTGLQRLKLMEQRTHGAVHIVSWAEPARERKR